MTISVKRAKTKVVVAVILAVLFLVAFIVTAFAANRMGYFLGYSRGSTSASNLKDTVDFFDKINGSADVEVCSTSEAENLLNSDSTQFFKTTSDGSSPTVIVNNGDCMLDLSQGVEDAITNYYGHGTHGATDLLAYSTNGQMKLIVAMKVSVANEGLVKENYEILNVVLDTMEVASVYKYDLWLPTENVDLHSVRTDYQGKQFLYYYVDLYTAYDCDLAHGCVELEDLMMQEFASNCSGNKVGLIKIDLATKQVTTLEKSAECV